MNNKDYWSKRLEELERMQILNESKYLETLKEEYEKAEIEKMKKRREERIKSGEYFGM